MKQIVMKGIEKMGKVYKTNIKTLKPKIPISKQGTMGYNHRRNKPPGLPPRLENERVWVYHIESREKDPPMRQMTQIKGSYSTKQVSALKKQTGFELSFNWCSALFFLFMACCALYLPEIKGSEVAVQASLILLFVSGFFLCLNFQKGIFIND